MWWFGFACGFGTAIAAVIVGLVILVLNQFSNYGRF